MKNKGKKKVIIIGGGIAGLSAGIYAQQFGYDTEIYEKNAVMGGECTGWERQGWHIDNCIHWLTGCLEGEELNEIWHNVGALDDSTELYREPYMYAMETENGTLHLWCDIERTRRELLDHAPEDEEQINLFLDSVKKAECVKVPCAKSMADMGMMDYIRMGMTMAEMPAVLKEYGGQTIAQMADRFHNPDVRRLIGGYLDGNYKAIPLISSYAFYTSGTAAIPMGGSVAMAQRITRRYEQLGGVVHTNAPVERVNIVRGKAQSVTLKDGTVVPCDAVICACDTAITFGRLLERKYMDKKLRTMYEKEDSYITTSNFSVVFGIIGNEPISCPSGTTVFPCEGYTVGKKPLDMLGVRIYDYDPLLFPADRRVIMCNITQSSADYEYWKALYVDRERYKAEKARIAGEIEQRIKAKYPDLADRLVLLDTFTPVTFERWCGAYHGAYMSFFEQPGAKSLTAGNADRGLNNVFIASQWLTTNGGLPIAVTQGKFAAMKLAQKVK